MIFESPMMTLLCALVVSLFLLICCTSQAFNTHHKHPAAPLFIFGDSIFDVGNNNYLNVSDFSKANFWPYGITYFHYPTGRFSNGRLIPDFIAEHANLPLVSPFLKPSTQSEYHSGVNFASGGAGALVETYQGFVIDIHMQLANFKEYRKRLTNKLGDAKSRKISSRAVYMFSIGGNDYGSLFVTNSTLLTTYTKLEYVNMVIGNITSVINEIYKMGGRKFVFLNVPPVECFPILRLLNTNRDGGCHKEASKYIRQHNKVFLDLLTHLEKKLPGFRYSVYDFYTSLLQRIDLPKQYGFKEGKTACCGSGKYRGVFSCGGKRGVEEYELCKNIDDHVFWDSGHPTEKACRQIADEMWSNTNNILQSYSIKELLYMP